MKNRRIVIVAFMLVAALCLGIGYATVSDDLTVPGKMNVDADGLDAAFETNVYFVSSSTAATLNSIAVGDKIEANITDVDGAADTFEVTVKDTCFTAVGDVLIIYVDIKNATTETDVNVNIVDAAANASLTMFDFEMVAVDSNTTIAKNSTETYKITITLKKFPAEDVVAADFGFTLTATPIN